MRLLGSTLSCSRSVSLAVSLALGAGCAGHARPSITLYEKGDYAGAARAAEEGLARHPDEDALWGMRIRAALALGDGPAIATAYRAYVERRHEDDAELLRDVAVATLRQALASPSARLQIVAIGAVQDAELHGLADDVAERMGSDDDRVAAAAAVAVLRGYPQAPQVASDMLRSEDPEARRIAVEGIARKIGDQAADDLQRAAIDTDARVRRIAIRYLGELKVRAAVPMLTRRLRDPDEAVRATTVTALGRIGQGDLAQVATAALADRALAVRLAGLALLVELKQTAALTRLAEADPEPLVAAEAALAVARPELAARALDAALASEQWTHRAGAVHLSRRVLGPVKAFELARRLAEDPEVGVRLAAARVLAAGGDRAAAWTIFAHALTSPAHALQAATELALQGDPRGLAALDAAVVDAAHPAEDRAAAVAAHRSARRITPGLVAALADPSGLVRVEAAAVLVVLAR